MSTTLLADAQRYARANDPSFPLRPSQFSVVWGPGNPVDDPIDAESWYGEQGVDVEAVHAVAPGANVAFVAAQSDSDSDVVAALNFVIDDHLADIVSSSWSGIEFGMDVATFQAFEPIAIQAGLKGVSLFFAAGDSGDYSFLYGIPRTVAFPASLPEVTAVGGTTLVLARDNSRLFETGWETGISLLEPAEYSGVWSPGCAAQVSIGPGAMWWPAAPGGYCFGSGGGISAVYAQPLYQVVTVPAALASAGGSLWRALPDVSMLGDPYTGLQVGESVGGVYSESPVGGSSLATPLFAAAVSLAEQRRGKSFGFINPRLYASPRAFSDIVSLRPGQGMVNIVAGLQTSVSTFDYRGPENSLETAPGFDDVTGLGTPAGEDFLSELGRF
ncbi:MAG: S53 family peptidase [Polyangiaceae bacterium]